MSLQLECSSLEIDLHLDLMAVTMLVQRTTQEALIPLSSGANLMFYSLHCFQIPSALTMQTAIMLVLHLSPRPTISTSSRCVNIFPIHFCFITFISNNKNHKATRRAIFYHRLYATNYSLCFQREATLSNENKDYKGANYYGFSITTLWPKGKSLWESKFVTAIYTPCLKSA